MNRKKIIGIPIKNLVNPMSRLSEILTQDERIHTQRELIQNIVQSFKNNDCFISINLDDISLLNKK